jgi:ubiquinone biosynthesis protein COQ4
MPTETVPLPASGPLVLGLGALASVSLALQNDMRRRGLRATGMVLRRDDDESLLVRALQSQSWTCVVVGAGISGLGPRAPPATAESEAYFRRVQALVAQHAPTAKIALPHGPHDLYAAMQHAGMPPPPISEAQAVAAASASTSATSSTSAPNGDEAPSASAAAWYAAHKAHYTPLSLMQRSLLFAGSSALALLNPHRGDLVAAVGELTGPILTDMPLQHLLDRMRASEEGRWILRHKPRWTSASLPAPLSVMRDTYPSNSLGARYAHFMLSRDYSPDARTPVRFIADPELAYVLQRYREIHDVLHVLTDMPTSVLGELGQKAFEAAHFKLTMPRLSAALAPTVTLTQQERAFYNDTLLPWSERLQASVSGGGSADDTSNSGSVLRRPPVHLLAIRYEQYLRHDLDDLRREWGIIPAPQFPTTTVAPSASSASPPPSQQQQKK